MVVLYFVDFSLIWTVDWDMIEKHWNSAKRSDRRIWLDESKLRWTPKIYTPNNDFFLRSPLRSPLLSPVVQPFRVNSANSANITKIPESQPASEESSGINSFPNPN